MRMRAACAFHSHAQLSPYNPSHFLMARFVKIWRLKASSLLARATGRPSPWVNVCAGFSYTWTLSTMRWYITDKLLLKCLKRASDFIEDRADNILVMAGLRMDSTCYVVWYLDGIINYDTWPVFIFPLHFSDLVRCRVSMLRLNLWLLPQGTVNTIVNAMFMQQQPSSAPNFDHPKPATWSKSIVGIFKTKEREPQRKLCLISTTQSPFEHRRLVQGLYVCIIMP